MLSPHYSRCPQRPRLVGPKLASEGRWLNSVYFRVFGGQKLPKTNATCPPLNTQNKPISSTPRIVVSHCIKRTQASSLEPPKINPFKPIFQGAAIPSSRFVIPTNVEESVRTVIALPVLSKVEGGESAFLCP